MNRHAAPQSLLSQRLLDGLARFRRDGGSGLADHAPGLFSYCALTRERLIATRLETPVLGVVLSGAKEVWSGAESRRMGEGTIFVLPGRTGLDIVNEPGGRNGLYQSLILAIEPDSAPDLGPAPPREGVCDCVVAPTPGLVEAMLHATAAIAAGPAGERVRAARLAETLALLHGASAAAPLFDCSTGERVARLIRAGLDEAWSAAGVARRLGLSESTLRRRLADERRGFADILRGERMAAARRMIAAGAGSEEAMLAVGYASRAHFARAYRACNGVNPGSSQPPSFATSASDTSKLA